MLEPLAVTTSASAQHVLARIGRTEDLCFSPDNRRLAVAEFGHDAILVFDIEVDSSTDDLHISLHGVTELQGRCLTQPHGLAFLDHGTLAVANRIGDVVILRLPPAVPGMRSVEAAPLATIGVDTHGVSTPGSVAVTQLAAELFEVLVCNNYANSVTRHLVDLRHGCRAIGAEVIAASGLDVPDGVAISGDRRWIAVSNHSHHSVAMFDRAQSLGPHQPAVGVLRNVHYPHGLAFTSDDRHVVVADAGSPFLYVFARGADDWTGGREPIATLRLMDDETFLRGRYNVQEGGPKGLEIDRTGQVLAITSEHQPLEFFALAQLIGKDDEVGPPPVEAGVRLDEAGRELLVDTLGRNDDLLRQLADRDTTIVELESRVAELLGAVDASEATEHRHLAMAEDRQRRVLDLLDSTSWRATAPLRWASGVRQRLTGSSAPAEPDGSG